VFALIKLVFFAKQKYLDKFERQDLKQKSVSQIGKN
jgi:hypothetical protein